ncbi:MAG TPA: toxin-antitoxin system protein [Vicinamibacteria bacterium]|nr:toxin-antitoxin system protein [Vicinamibacteria bacterium]
MGHTTMRISDSAREVLRQMARVEGRTMQALLEEAIETLRRKRFLEEVNAAYASLRRDAKAWAAVERERRGWDRTLLDGLTVHEPRGGYDAGAKRRPRRKRT